MREITINYSNSYKEDEKSYNEDDVAKIEDSLNKLSIVLGYGLLNYDKLTKIDKHTPLIKVKNNEETYAFNSFDNVDVILTINDEITSITLHRIINKWTTN